MDMFRTFCATAGLAPAATALVSSSAFAQDSATEAEAPGAVQLGFAALQEFAQSDRAVRWWHVSLPVDAHTGRPAIELSGSEGNPTRRVWRADRAI
jgi:hypothetical protein